MIRHAFLLLVAALCAGGSAMPMREPEPPKAQPVLVRFENLYWVGAKTFLPFVAGGQTYVPTLEACDLLGLICTLGKDSLGNGTVKVSGQTLAAPPVIVVENTGRQTFSSTALSPLVKLAGQKLVWDAASKTATVSGGSGSRGWRYALEYLGQPQNVYAGPLQTSRGGVVKGSYTVQQSIFAPSTLGGLTLFTKAGNSLSYTGSLAPSSPDVHNAFKGCGGQPSCTLPAPRDALWVLAYATAK